MYPFIRLIATLYNSRRAPKLAPRAQSTMTFYCRPWDVDLYWEMNNGRILTLYDLGRFDLAIRTGLNRVLSKNNWGLVIAGSTVRYRKRIRMFNLVTMHTQVVAMEGRWIYIAQSMWVGDKPTSSVLLRTAVTAKGKAIDSSEVIKALGIPETDLEPKGWVKAWIDADAERPWPPVING